MSWQERMPFSKCSNSEAKTLYTSNFAIKEIKGITIISDKQNPENKAFQMGFMHLKIQIKEKFEPKTKLTEIKNFKICSV